MNEPMTPNQEAPEPVFDLVNLPELTMPVVLDETKVLPMTKRQITAVNIYLQHSDNYPVLVKKLRDELGPDFSVKKLEQLLKDPNVQNYVQVRLRDMGAVQVMSRERWEREAMEFRDGLRPVNNQTAAMHKLLGLSRGYLQGSGSGTTINQQINFQEKE